MSKEWKARLIRVLLCFFIACIVEALVFVFADNLKYQISPSAVPVLKYERLESLPEIWKDKKTVYRVKLDPIDLKAFSFVVKDIDRTTPLSLCDAQGNNYLKKLIRYPTHTVFSLSEALSDCSEFFLVSDDFVLIDEIKVSNEEPIIVQDRSILALRWLFWFVASLFVWHLVAHYRSIKNKLQEFYKKYFAGLNWKRLFLIFVLFEVFSFIVTAVLAVILRAEYIPHLVLWSVLGGVLLFFFFLYFEKKIEKIETLYLLSIYTLMACYIFAMPFYTYGGDSQTHLNRVIASSGCYTEVDYPSYRKAMDEDGFYHYDGLEEVKESVLAQRVSRQDIPVLYFPSEKYIAYLPAVCAFFLADAFHLSPHLAFYAGELFQSVFAFWLIYCGIKRLKSGKIILMLFATLPGIFRLLSIYTYNNWIFPWMFYFMAYVISEIQSKDKVMQIKDLLKILGSLFLACLPKTPYFVLGFIVFLIPKEKFSGKLSYRRFVLISATIIGLLLAVLLMPILIGNMDVYSDTRGGQEVSASGQALFILTNPLAYAKILLMNLKELFAPSYAVFSSIGLMIIRNNVLLPFSEGLLVLFLIAVFFDHCEYDARAFSIKKRLIIYWIILFNTIWITTVMYMNYTPVGSEVIKGMNPLYATAYMFPLWFCLGIRKPAALKQKRIFNCCIWGSWVAVLYFGMFKTVICSIIV